MKCKKCSHILSKNTKFCPECGTPVPQPQPEPKSQEIKVFPPILTVEQAAKFLSISRCQLYVLIRNEGLPWFTVGAHKRFITDELIAWSKKRQETCLDRDVV